MLNATGIDDPAIGDFQCAATVAEALRRLEASLRDWYLHGDRTL
jgi:hypothetical protein